MRTHNVLASTVGSSQRRWPALATAVLFAGVARSAPPPLPLEDQAKVGQAIVQGVYYLKLTQQPDGTWPAKDKGHPVGYAALAGLTLLECGVPADDPSVRLAAAHVRGAYYLKKPEEQPTSTYDLALSILFLDRLDAYNERLMERIVEGSVDRRLIEVLTLRLVAGQTATGGWTYSCPVLNEKQHAQLLVLLRQPRPSLTGLPAFFRRLPVLQDPAKLMVKTPPKPPPVPARGAEEQKAPAAPTSDNSNTQFAILALWVAQRYQLPLERSVRLIAKRFRTSQNPDGGWGYTYSNEGGAPTGAAMTCAGLLGLAIEHGFRRKADSARRPPSAARSAPIVATAVMSPTPVPLYAAARVVRQIMAAETAARGFASDPMIAKGLQALTPHVGQPTGRQKDIPIGNFYFLWSVERVAMLYDLPTVGDRNWYRWGMEMLLANQKPEGHWDCGTTYPGAHPSIDTCFAVLFLRQTNLAEDLTDKLRLEPKTLGKSAPPAGDDTPRAQQVVINAPGAKPAPPPGPDVAKTDKPAATSPAPATRSLTTSATPKETPAAPQSEATSSPSERPRPTSVHPAVAAGTSPGPEAGSQGRSRTWLWAGLGGVFVLLAGSAVLLLWSRQERLRQATVAAPLARKKAGVPRNGGKGPERRPAPRKKGGRPPAKD
jgi:hypothetical protein